MSDIVIVGAVLCGKYKSNADQWAKVVAFNPNNARRVLLWHRSRRFVWNWVESIENHYGPALAPIETWGDPTTPYPVDPIDRPATKEATPVERVAAAEQAPAIAEAAPDVPQPKPATDEDVITISLKGDVAREFKALLASRAEVAMRLGMEATPATLIRTMVRNEIARWSNGEVAA